MAMSRKTAARIGWASVAASAAMIVSTAMIVARNGQPTGVFTSDGSPGGSAPVILGVGIGMLVFPIVGALIVSRKPENAIGWLFCAAGVLLPFGQFAAAYAYHALDTNPGSLPGGVLLALLSDTFWLPSIAFVTVFLLLLFPSGRPASHGDAIVFRVAIFATASAALGGLFEERLYGAPSITHPVGIAIAPQVSGVVIVAGLVGISACAIASVISLIRRFRSSRGEEHEQLAWFVFAASLVLVTWVPSNVFNHTPLWLQIASGLAALALPLSVGIAILKYRLFDIEVVIKKTVIFAVVVVVVTALYLLVALLIPTAVLGLGSSIQTWAVLFGVAIGLLIIPIRNRARRFADRLIYGKRATPYEVLEEFSGRMSEVYATEDVLPRMARILGEAVGAERAHVWLRLGDELRPAGRWPTDASVIEPARLIEGDIPELSGDLTVRVEHQGELLGALEVKMPDNDPMNPERERLVHGLAAQAGLVLRNARLIEELRASRQRLVAAQDEERRKIERNIHDGVQQHLVALAVQARLAQTLVGREEDKQHQALSGLQEGLQVALDELRDLARGIYPPLLADKGLAAALEAQARRAAIPTTVVAEGIHRYPKEIESAIYFSVLEGLTNVAKYAEASSAEIRVAQIDGRVSFSVTDDGKGFNPRETRYGTGLQGIADRLAAIDGTFEIRSEPRAGTTVTGAVAAVAVEART